MEKRLKIACDKNKLIYGTLNYKNPRPGKLVILVHGLLGYEDWAPLLEASRYFSKKGFAVFRFNLYHWEKGARRFRETTLSQHSRDLETVINYFKKKYNSIFVAGHSYGGLTVLNADVSDVTAVALWDPSSFIEHPPTYFRYSKKFKKYILPGAFDVLVEKKYVDNLKKYPYELDLISNIKKPVFIAYANGKDAVLKRSSKRYFKHANEPKELLSVPGASHCFREEGVAEVLFAGTVKFFNKFSRYK